MHHARNPWKMCPAVGLPWLKRIHGKCAQLQVCLGLKETHGKCAQKQACLRLKETHGKCAQL